jgi:NAD(P)-dependent dehydrogenase (short-subunit alcohol dehydrogenase family)
MACCSGLSFFQLFTPTVCADRTKAGAEATAAGIRAQGGTAESAACDAADSADVAGLAAGVMKRFPRLDIAVTTPGLNIRKTILDYTDEDLDRVINLNIKGTVWFFQAFGRIMVNQQGGSLMACSSVRAVTIEPGLTRGRVRHDQARPGPGV